uniref:Uncharacterized protein n=1 Tax=Arundo donax TaxID=35708 RepID=A0A0A8ZN46_ARUDO
MGAAAMPRSATHAPLLPAAARATPYRRAHHNAPPSSAPLLAVRVHPGVPGLTAPACRLHAASSPKYCHSRCWP